jgi:hypothetical protein
MNYMICFTDRGKINKNVDNYFINGLKCLRLLHL